jgi:isocitrate dehydrogenase
MHGIEGAIASRRLTFDLAALVEGATLVSTTDFAAAVVEYMHA